MEKTVTLNQIVEDAKRALDECLKPDGSDKIFLIPRIEDSEARRQAIEKSAGVLNKIIVRVFGNENVVTKNIDDVRDESIILIKKIYKTTYNASKFPDLFKYDEKKYIELSATGMLLAKTSDEWGPPPGWQPKTDTPSKTAQEPFASGSQGVSNNMKLGLAAAAAGLAAGAAFTGKNKPEEGKKKWTFVRVASTALLSATAVALSVSALRGGGSWAERVSSSPRGATRAI